MSKKVELLAPAGSMDALKAAINGGCDAIYVGGSRFNARAYATNFDIEELKDAVALCHLHGVRLFVTVNTVYKENEIEDLYAYLKELYQMQIDALIVQDEGMMHFIHRHFKDFEIHASTQCSIHNLDGVKHYQKKGVKRVVLARENTLEEIKYIHQNSDMELEAFVHGALCVSYSGQCYMSMLIGNRSANRGQCAQPCRLPYTLLKNGKTIDEKSFLLSCKDLCTIEQINDLIDAGIKSFKIEGRMKRPEYVYQITNYYRQAIDGYYEAKCKDIMAQIFNRDFTKGYLFNENQIVSPIYSGNRGVLIGEVIHYFPKSKKAEIRALESIHQGDGIRLGFSEDGKVLNKIYQKNKLVNQVSKLELFEIDTLKPISIGTKIYRTTKYELEKDIQKNIDKLYRKIPVTIQLDLNEQKQLVFSISDGFNKVECTSEQALEIAKKEVDRDRLNDSINKLGNTIYIAKQINISNEIYHYFIPVKILNDIRREAIEQLNELRSNHRVREIDEMKPYSPWSINRELEEKIYFHVRHKNQLDSILPLQKDEFLLIDFMNENLDIFNEIREAVLVVPTIMNEDSFKKIDQLKETRPDLKIAVNNIGAYERYQKDVILLLPGFNLSHIESFAEYEVAAVISNDLSYEEKTALQKSVKNSVIQTYGHIDSMTTKYCPVSYHAYGKKVERCLECKKGIYHLKDRANANFPLLFDDHCIIHILSEKPLNLPKMENSYLRFTIESNQEIKEILKKIRK